MATAPEPDGCFGCIQVSGQNAEDDSKLAPSFSLTDILGYKDSQKLGWTRNVLVEASMGRHKWKPGVRSRWLLT